jgi:hypothetical protein
MLQAWCRSYPDCAIGMLSLRLQPSRHRISWLNFGLNRTIPAVLSQPELCFVESYYSQDDRDQAVDS